MYLIGVLIMRPTRQVEEGEERRRLAGLVAALGEAMGNAVLREDGGRGGIALLSMCECECVQP
jgi:hypothetical protein